MALSFDGINKVITLSSGTTELGVRDLWSRWVDWLLTSDNSKYLIAFEQVGGNDIDISAGTSIPIYLFMQNGWKIKPQEANHTLNVNDGILLVDGGGDPFNNTSGAYVVRINYSQPVQAITVATGGGSGAPTASQIADAVLDEIVSDHSNIGSLGVMLSTVDVKTDEIHKLRGLDVDNPATQTLTSLTAGSITISVSGDLENETTFTRQP